MLQQQQQQTAAPTMEQILQFMAQQSEAITVLQQQLLAAQAAIATPAVAVAPTPVAAPVIVEVAPPPKFNGERSQMVGFINACCLFMQMRMGQVGERSRISWVLSYAQGEVSSCQFRVRIKPLLFISVRQRELVRVLAS